MNTAQFYNFLIHGDFKAVREACLTEKFNHDVLNPALELACTKSSFEIIKFITSSPELNIHANASHDALIAALKKGRRDVVDYLTSAPELVTHSQWTQYGNQEFVAVCEGGNIELIDMIINKYPHNIKELLNHDRGSGFKSACQDGHLPLVEYLLTDEKFKVAQLEKRVWHGIALAAINNELALLDFLLTSDKLNSEISQHHVNKAFQEGCASGHLEIVDYLLHSPKNFIHAQINFSENTGFKMAFQNKKFDLIEYFILQENISINDDLEFFLSEYKHVHEEVYDFVNTLLLHRQIDNKIEMKTTAPMKKKKI